MDTDNLSSRQRFDRLRQAMRWSWKAIDTITGRKNSCSNIAKRVPAWSMLAIEVHESYETLLHLHLLELISLRLGNSWKATKLSGGAVMFVGEEQAQNGELVWIDINFKPGEVSLRSNASKLYELVEYLSKLYPAIEDVLVQEDWVCSVRVPIVFE